MCVKIGKSQVQCLFAVYKGFISGRSLIEVHDCILCFILNIGTVNSSLNGYLYKMDTPLNRHLELVPTFVYFFKLNLCTEDASLRRTDIVVLTDVKKEKGQGLGKICLL